MNDFLTWETLLTYTNFVSVVFMIVEFTKEMKKVKKIPTRYWSFFVAFFLLICVHVALGSFLFKDILLYLLTAISVSLGTNGLSDFNWKKDNKK